MADYDKSKNKDTRFGGTGGIQVSSGSNAERVDEVGRIRYNADTGQAEVYSSLGWGSFGTPPPDLQSISPTSYNGEGGTTITLTGSNFTAEATVFFVDSSGTDTEAGSVTFNSASEVEATTPQDYTVAQGPLDIRIEQNSGTSTLVDALSTGGSPVWSTGSSLGTVTGGSTSSITLVATDPDAGATITYSLASGSLPGGITLQSNGALSGTFSNVSSSTTSNFTARATDNAGNTADRAFSITVQPAFISATGGTVNTDGDYRYHTFNSPGTFTVNNIGADPTFGDKIRYLIVAGGGGGAGFGSQGPGFPGDGNFGSGGGGGAGGMLDSGGYNQTVSATAYPVQVGGGGSGGVGSQDGSPGSPSFISNIATATGGGGGGRQDAVGLPGGSGGGSGTDGQGFNTASSGVPGQGNRGGQGANTQTGYSGGGGGAGGAGTDTRDANTVGYGGNGLASDITGSSVVYAGGGGGSRYPGGPHVPSTAPLNGGGGGRGSNVDTGSGVAGTGNTGGGGGGANDQDPRDNPQPFGGTGGSGVVIVKYKFQ